MVAIGSKMAGTMARPPKEPDAGTYLGRVALRLKSLRESQGIDQKAAAKKITAAGYKAAMSTVYRWEQGAAFPHIKALPAIAKAYGTTPRNVLPQQ